MSLQQDVGGWYQQWLRWTSSASSFGTWLESTDVRRSVSHACHLLSDPPARCVEPHRLNRSTSPASSPLLGGRRGLLAVSTYQRATRLKTVSLLGWPLSPPG
jgi:hypothetical protein